MKIAVVCPTKNRPEFLEFFRYQISIQTLKPDILEIVDDESPFDGVDITWRYRIGCDRVINKGADVILFMEDDDYYSNNYIERMVAQWRHHGSPELFGLGKTIYYNLMSRKWTEFSHPGRASMMSTLVKADAVKKINWGEDNYAYTDIVLWTKNRLGSKVVDIKGIAVGIKHGVGLVGGGGHLENWGHYRNSDDDLSVLKKMVSYQAMQFYCLQIAKKKLELKYIRFVSNPFLTIITRRMDGKRLELFENHKRSIAPFILDIEQCLIIDKHKLGMWVANTSFQLPEIRGEYVYLLDDDDFILNNYFILELKKASINRPGVIVFKMYIRNGDGDEIFPKIWNRKDFKRGQIGGSCFVIRNDLFKKYINHFSHERMGDWEFITNVLRDENIKVEWIDSIMAETGRVSRGED